jgi:hypothetical protein
MMAHGEKGKEIDKLDAYLKDLRDCVRGLRMEVEDIVHAPDPLEELVKRMRQGKRDRQ